MNTEEFGNACMDFSEARDLGVIVSALRSCGRAVVVSHARPDGDAYGCSLGLCLSMRESGRNAVFVVSGEIPAMYWYLEPAGVMVSPDMFVRKPGDVVFVLDCGELSRLQKEVAAAVEGLPLYCIDHHKSTRGLGKGTYLDPDASSTSELVMRVVSSLGLRLPRPAAEALWTGIVTDTGRFAYSCTSASTLRCGALLVEAGARTDMINSSVYETVRINRLMLLRRLLGKLHVFGGGRAAVASLSAEDYAAENCGPDDSENFVDVARAVGGVDAAAFVRQLEDGGPVFISIRTHAPFDAAQVCSAWGGGGHARAAGASASGKSLDETVREVESALQAFFE